MRTPRKLTVTLLPVAALALGGCTNPDAPATAGGQAAPVSSGNAGEPQAPPPPSAATQTPLDVRTTPTAAIESFAQLYSNWNYQTLTARQRTLAEASVGPARLSEQQAAASSAADSTTRGHLHNSGQVLAIAADERQPDLWIVTTLEETTGNGEYQGLPAGFHVTLARTARVPGGYAVSEWLPQS